MSFLSWNFQGLGWPQDLTIQRLRELHQYQFPEILFLMETKKCRNIVVDLQVWLDYEREHTVNPIGYSGGLAILWKKNVNLCIKSADKNVVDCYVKFGDSSFFLTCVYGEPAADGKSLVWDKITKLGLGRSEAWSLVGDFNEILSNDEKSGGPRRPEASFKFFAGMLSACDMEELTSKGNIFTWAGQRWKKYVQCCLDRCFGNKAWHTRFPNSNQTFLDKRGSDHRPVLVNLRESPAIKRGQFRFDRRLLHHPDAVKEVETAWRKNTERSSVGFKTRKCRKVMSE